MVTEWLLSWAAFLAVLGTGIALTGGLIGATYQWLRNRRK